MTVETQATQTTPTPPDFQTVKKSILALRQKVISRAQTVGCQINPVWISEVASLWGLHDHRSECGDLLSMEVYYRLLKDIAENGFREEDGDKGARAAEGFKEWLLRWRRMVPRKLRDMDIPKKAQKQLEKDRQERRARIIVVRDELLESAAFHDLSYAPALKVLFWCYEKKDFALVQVRGKKKPQWKETGKPFSFTYDEARARGLTDAQFSRALRELHSRGFLDVERYGSGLQGDFSRYTLSDRWKDFGKPEFRAVPFTRAVPFGFREG